MAWLKEQNKGRKIGWNEDQDDKEREEHPEKEERVEHE